MAKDHQEHEAAALFAQGYAGLTGVPVSHMRRPAAEPPDFLFDSAGERVGVELFQLESLNETRARARALVNAVYREFHERIPDDRYLGMVVDFGVLMSPTWAADTQAKLRGLGVRNPNAQVALELVELIAARIPSARCVPDEAGMVLVVDEDDFAALSMVTGHVFVRRIRPETTLRSDGRAAPLVQAEFAFSYGYDEMCALAMTKIHQKAGMLSAWPLVGRRILVAHDVPRWERDYLLVNWPELLAPMLPDLQATSLGFDEIWLVANHHSETDFARRAARIFPREAG